MSCGTDLCTLPGRMSGGGCGCGGVMFGTGRGRLVGGVCPLALAGYPGMKGGGDSHKIRTRGYKGAGCPLKGGGCGCGNSLFGTIKAGYKATRRNKQLLRKYKSGKSIGFSAVASLKAKGLLRRANKTIRKSSKYARRTIKK